MTQPDPAADAFGRIDVLFVNAGLASYRPPEQVDEPFYDKLFALNARGPFFLVQETVKVMPDGGSIVLFVVERPRAGHGELIGLRGQQGGAALARAQMGARIPLKRVGRPAEVAYAALFLASDESSFTTGMDLPVDGGILDLGYVR